MRWESVGLSPNVALVGTVNMDESAHGFSRKVLDRAFTLELSEIDFTWWERIPSTENRVGMPDPWPVSAWYPRAISLAGLAGLTEAERDRIRRSVAAVAEANRFLVPAGQHAAYRTLEEIALFVLHAADVHGSFRTRGGEAVAPLDLALQMKLLPRIIGGSPAVRRAVLGLLGWARSGHPIRDESEARRVIEEWEGVGSPATLNDARYPRTAARLCLMWQRFLEEGFTSFWS